MGHFIELQDTKGLLLIIFCIIKTALFVHKIAHGFHRGLFLKNHSIVMQGQLKWYTQLNRRGFWAQTKCFWEALPDHYRQYQIIAGC